MVSGRRALPLRSPRARPGAGRREQNKPPLQSLRGVVVVVGFDRHRARPWPIPRRTRGHRCLLARRSSSSGWSGSSWPIWATLFIPACLGSIHPSLSFFSPASNQTEHTAPLATPSLHWQAALVGLVRRFQFGYFNQVCPVLQSKVKVTASCKPSPHSTSYKSSSPAAAGEKHNEPSRGKCPHFPNLSLPQKPLLLYLFFPSRQQTPVSSEASSSDPRPLRDEH